MNQNTVTLKSGYLNNDFKLFHIIDKQEQTFEFHYHDFNKIIIFLSGNVTYLIEGKAYKLKPWDILLVNNKDIHKPVIDPTQTYDRIIIWADSDFILKHNYEGSDLTSCFKIADAKSFNLIRTISPLQAKLKEIIEALDHSFHSNEFGSRLLSNSLFLELLIYINRLYLETTYIYDSNIIETDKQIDGLLSYIKDHIAADLSADTLAKEFYISKHYLMHKFKAKTGYTLHSYILKKRLFIASSLMKEGTPIIKAAQECGFNDYSTFLRAFRKVFQLTPSEYLNNRQQL